jgi:hypothetical protein
MMLAAAPQEPDGMTIIHQARNQRKSSRPAVEAPPKPAMMGLRWRQWRAATLPWQERSDTPLARKDRKRERGRVRMPR